MRLTKTNPQTLIGRTIKFHGFWRVDTVTDEDLILSRGVYQGTKGRMKLRQLKDAMLCLDLKEIGKQYPRLLKCMRHACLLTSSEAESAVRGYLFEGPMFYGADSVARIGGAARAIRLAMENRHRILSQRVAGQPVSL